MIPSHDYTRRRFAPPLLGIAWAATAVLSLAQSAAAAEPAEGDSAADEVSRGEQVWTCPMHTQIRQAESGKCPICGLELTATGEKSAEERPELIGLQEMLSIALEHNANVRVAQARVRAAEAELDRTRFEVLQQIMAFRDKWQTHRSELSAALYELRAAEAAAENQVAAQAREQYFQRRAKLREIEAELPFLLGHATGKTAPEPDAASRELIREELLPKARQILEIRTREYAAGNASVLDVLSAHRQVVDFEAQLAGAVADTLK